MHVQLLTWLVFECLQTLRQGLAALLVQGLSGCAAEQIARLSPEWITAMGLSQSLTPSRNNGFLNMFLLMQKKALGLLMDAGASAVRPGNFAPLFGRTCRTVLCAASLCCVVPGCHACCAPYSQAPEAPAASGSDVRAAAGNGAAAALPQASSSSGAAPAGGGSGGGQSRTPVRDSMLRKLAERLRPERCVPLTPRVGRRLYMTALQLNLLPLWQSCAQGGSRPPRRALPSVCACSWRQVMSLLAPRPRRCTENSCERGAEEVACTAPCWA